MPSIKLINFTRLNTKTSIHVPMWASSKSRILKVFPK